ncbi:MAG: UDP-N-acetyl-D-glucosamine 2-epimerase, UDP-hydrolysing [Omnitrophica WOR_2 bacterium GWA2_47_8]|nr:MAG: UDP-N-acetyl-D-glucosamine 2-epimerase, UDP-hydrolysing [Omnitrophica WOR_2 bacterium GWA2_47_8]
MKRKICVFTGTRAEYGLLKPLLDEIKNDKQLTLQLLVTGMHLSPEFGNTYKDIERDGFHIDEKVDISLGSDTPAGIAKSMGLGVMNFGEVFARLKPDVVVMLGDRFEALAAAIAAMLARIPIAHLSGGESTEGLIDESIRHSLTKLSYLHFTSMDQYRRRVIQLGEDPKRVFQVGAIALDNIRNLKLLSKQELEKQLNFKFKEHNLLVTFHPVTLENNTSKGQFQDLLAVLDSLKDTHLVFTKANADTDGRIINQMIDAYVAKNPHKASGFTSLGQLRYLSLMKYVDAVVGNSSSGIVEAPSFKIGTVNIGDRQRGRIRAQSVIDCLPTKEGIQKALRKVYSKEFQEQFRKTINPYGDGRSSARIKAILKRAELKDLKKKFYDVRAGV